MCKMFWVGREVGKSLQSGRGWRRLQEIELVRVVGWRGLQEIGLVKVVGWRRLQEIELVRVVGRICKVLGMKVEKGCKKFTRN